MKMNVNKHSKKTIILVVDKATCQKRAATINQLLFGGYDDDDEYEENQQQADHQLGPQRVEPHLLSHPDRLITEP